MKDPGEKIQNDLLISVLWLLKSLIAEEIQRTWEDGSGIIKALYSGG